MLAVLFAILLGAISCLPSSFKLGFLFVDNEASYVKTWVANYALLKINHDLEVLPYTRLIPEVQYVPDNDSFSAMAAVCDLFNRGVRVIFGPSHPVLAKIVQSVCDVFDIPFLEARIDSDHHIRQFSINLHPSYEIITDAILDLVHYLNWTDLFLIYECDQDLQRLQHLLVATWKRFNMIPKHTISKNYSAVLKEIKATHLNNFILHISTENIEEMLRAIENVGMNDDKYHFIFTSLDVHTVNLKEFHHSYLNMTAFRVIDEQNEDLMNLKRSMQTDLFFIRNSRNIRASNELRTADATLCDAIQLFAKGLHSLGEWELNNVSCTEEAPWQYGSSLFNYMNSGSFEGLTGLLQFKEGKRSNVKLDILKLMEDRFMKVGVWKSGVINIGSTFYDYSQRSVVLRVTTLLEDPYVMESDSSDLTGKTVYKGFCIDLLKAISNIVGFDYEIHLVPDKKYGIFDLKTNEWNGIVRELIDKKADLAVGSMSITHVREAVIDFTNPFMHLGISILFKIPTSDMSKIFFFMNPFVVEIWIYSLLSYILVSVTIFVVSRISPREKHSAHPCLPESRMKQGHFTLGNSFWFAIGTLMQQESELNPKKTSTRIVMGIWWFFTLIIISSYTANLAAFLTVERMTTPIQSAADLVEQNDIEYGILQAGTTMTFFRDSKVELYKKMWNIMENRKPSVFVATYEEGIQRVLQGNYAFFMENTMLEYMMARDCNLTQIGGLLDSKEYGIATPKGSPWNKKISLAILKLQEKGVIQMLYNKWWKNTGNICHRELKSKHNIASSLGIETIGGIFIVLLGGLMVASMVSIVEFYWHSRRNKKLASVCKEMARELWSATYCSSSNQRLTCQPD